MMVRVMMEIEEQLDHDLVAYAAVKRGDISQATVDEIIEAALTQFLQEAPFIQGWRTPGEEEWSFETPVGHFHVCNGRIETLPGKLCADRVVETLAAIYREAENTADSTNHFQGGEPC